MDISSISDSGMTPELQALYAIKCIQMAQEAEQVAASIIQDTVELSQEALEKFFSEI